MAEKTKKNNNFRCFAVLAVIFFILAFIVLSIVIFQNTYKEKIYPGIKIGNLNLSGKTKDQAAELLNQFSQQFQPEGIVFTAENNLGKVKRVKISPMIISLEDPDLSREILSFDIKGTVEKMYSVGRQGTFFEQFGKILDLLIFKNQYKIIYHLDEQELDEMLKDNFKDFENLAKDAYLKTENGVFSVGEEEQGFTFDYQQGLEDLKNNIDNLIYQTINLKIITDYPEITKTKGGKIIDQAYEISELAPIKLTYKEYWWRISDIKSFLNLKLNKNGEVMVGLDEERISNYLKIAAEDIDIEARDAEFEMKDGRVVIFKPSKIGQKINTEKSFEKIEKELFEEKNMEIELVIEESQPKIATADINNLGIKELIGVGKSNFSGSPNNRRHNIKVGAETLNGILIEPKQEFSVNKSLGRIGPDQGYLPELVIKGNRTIPEYGGGLCQIGTTAFRVALNSGLPITERRPHSYRVSYYEPAGMDATIYNPRPDLRFINDTSSHILFLTRIDEDDLIFEFWGSDDGRKVEVSEPKIFNITTPGPARYIESENLAPGETQMIERAHNGADAEFTRTITYSDPEKELVEELWETHYNPWRAVYLIGKTPTSSEKILEE